MNYEYIHPKKEFKAKDIKKAQLFFKNGDFILLSEKEIVDIDVKFYDNLIMGQQEYSPVGKSGFIKCKIDEKKPQYDSFFLYNAKEYVKDRKNYIEQRCINESAISHIRLFNENYWSDTIYGDIIACFEDEYLLLTFQDNKTYGSAEKDYHTINAGNVTKKNVEKILLDFENCDGFEIFPEEIQDIQINFEKNLNWNSHGFAREVKNGYIKLKLDKKITWRWANIYCGTKNPNIKNLAKRLYGKGEDEIDICHLYVTYKYAGYGMQWQERISVKDIPLIQETKHKEEFDCYSYVSGYAKKEPDGSILIFFGKKK